MNAMPSSPEFRVFDALHDCWADLVVLQGDGRFRRVSTSCAGRWEESPEGELTLAWDGWGTDTLPRQDGLHRNDSLRLREIDARRIDPGIVRTWAASPAADPEFGANGAWIGNASHFHSVDAPLAAAIADFLEEQGCRSVVDCGCGSGAYVSALRVKGLDACGFDGNPSTPLMTLGLCGTLDLGVHGPLPSRDAALCLEVGEHLPPESEDAILDNVCRAAERWLILSWAVPGQGGADHRNERSNDHVTEQLHRRGFERDPNASSLLREKAGISWFKNTLMVFRRTESAAPLPRILVGICSSQAHTGRREAARETWLSHPRSSGVECRFFLGGTNVPEQPDTVVLPVDDSYEGLPGKVLAFFAHALETSDFDWLFKCDDDTYVDLHRLRELAVPGHDLVGNEFLTERGTPSGGAGYLLSRRMVERLVQDRTIPLTGEEDVLIGKAAARHGAKVYATSRLCWHSGRFPGEGNDTVTSHWCSPERLHQIERLRELRRREVFADRETWQDRLFLDADGRFSRATTPCGGSWSEIDQGVIRLEWDSWEPEHLIPKTSIAASTPGASGSEAHAHLPAYYCRKHARDLTIELRGGMGNQMFQYAHALALARRLGTPLRVSYANYGHPFSLGMFGIRLDPEPAGPVEFFDYCGAYRPGEEWLSYTAFADSPSPHLKLAGYFQNERYFLPSASEIRAVFAPLLVRRPECPGKTLVVVHVRRGDFLASRAHDLCRPAYYRQAMRLMRGLVKHPVFHFVSDDPAWCETEFGGDPDVRIVPEQSQEEAMMFMSSADAFILSNSTFGWWGAWLADASPVIAPSRFLEGREWPVCPERWITLPPEGVEVSEVEDPEAEPVSPKRVALLVIATGGYTRFLPELLRSADEHFLPGHHVDYFIFSDQTPGLDCSRPVHLHRANHEAWPMVVLRRYGIHLSQESSLRDFDYLYSCDADMRFIGPVTEAIFSERVAVQHPGYHGRRGTPESRPESTAYIPESTPMQYFCGAFLGGEAGAFLDMARAIESNVKRDLDRRLIAVWHDESHSNRYFVDHPPTRILDPGYCWVRNYRLPFVPRLEALDKDHAEVRACPPSPILHA